MALGEQSFCAQGGTIYSRPVAVSRAGLLGFCSRKKGPFASELTYTVPGGALNSTHSLTPYMNR